MEPASEHNCAAHSVTLNHLHLSVHSISTTVHQLAAQQQRDLHTHTTNMQTITERLQSIETFMNPQRVSRQPPDVVTLASHTTHGSSVKPSADNTLVCSNLANYSTASLAQYVDRGSVVTALAIQARQASRYTCKSYCRCSCHQEKVARSSPMLDLIIGSLFIGYSGQPSLLNPCDAGDCKKRCASHFQVTYVFPRWFLAKVVTVAVTAVPAAGPQAFFAVHRSVSPTSEIFYHAKSGNVEKLKELFRLGAASPNDVHCASGVVALDVRSPVSSHGQELSEKAKLTAELVRHILPQTGCHQVSAPGGGRPVHPEQEAGGVPGRQGVE